MFGRPLKKEGILKNIGVEGPNSNPETFTEQ